MTGKKIEFLKKPSVKDTNKFIDNWVSGNTESKELSNQLQRTTFYLPEELHKKLKVRAASDKTSMTEIIISSLEKYLA